MMFSVAAGTFGTSKQEASLQQRQCGERGGSSNKQQHREQQPNRAMWWCAHNTVLLNYTGNFGRHCAAVGVAAPRGEFSVRGMQTKYMYACVYVLLLRHENGVEHERISARACACRMCGYADCVEYFTMSRVSLPWVPGPGHEEVERRATVIYIMPLCVCVCVCVYKHVSMPFSPAQRVLMFRDEAPPPLFCTPNNTK